MTAEIEEQKQHQNDELEQKQQDTAHKFREILEK